MHGICGYGLLATIILALSVFSCGNGGITDPGGGWGSQSTNSSISLTLLPGSVELDICNDVSVGLIANISAQQINPALPPNTLYLEGYDVVIEAEVSGYPDMDGGNYKLTSVLPVTDLDLFFVDPGIKAAFLNDLNTGQYAGIPEFPAYSAKYTAYGTDEFNATPRIWGSRASFSFKMGRYSTCVPSISPATVTKTGIANPDVSSEDDMTFTITGGTAPYSVISNSTSLIESPGDLGIGNMVFTVDPDRPGSTTEVTLTVTDADNQSTVATVTLNP